MRGWASVIVLCSVLACLPAAAFGQATQASIAGVVRDTSGAVLPGGPC